MSSKKVTDLTVKPQELVDSIVIVSWVDSDFVKITEKDTSGFLVDFINRFFEENSINVTYKLYHHLSQALEAFLKHPNHFLFVPSDHFSMQIKSFRFSKSIIERNLPLTNELLSSLLTLNYST